MKFCYGIRVADDDIQDYVTFPVAEADEENQRKCFSCDLEKGNIK